MAKSSETVRPRGEETEDIEEEAQFASLYATRFTPGPEDRAGSNGVKALTPRAA